MDKLQQIIQLIHQGNPQALAAFFNGHLNKKGLYFKISQKNEVLNILVESKKEPPQDPVIELIIKAFKSHQFRCWSSLKVYGKQQGEDFPSWIKDIDVSSELPTLADLAKQGNPEALKSLLEESIKQKLNYDTLTVSIKNSTLRIKIENKPEPKQDETVDLVIASLQAVDFSYDLEIHIYGQETGEDIPDWHFQTILSLDSKETFIQKDDLTTSKVETPNLKEEEISSDNDTSQNMPRQISEITVIDNCQNLKLDSLRISNDVYSCLNTKGFNTFIQREDELENENDVHKIVEIFIDNLEDDLKADISNLSIEFQNLIESLNLPNSDEIIQCIDESKTSILESEFTHVKSSLRNLRKVTRDVQNQDFPEDQSISDIFINGIAEFAGFGSSIISKEAAIGSLVGSIIAPGLGTVLGAAIGGWMGGSKQGNKIEEVIEKYTTAKDDLLEAWNSLLGHFYVKIQKNFDKILDVKLLEFDEMEEAWASYQEATNLLNKLEESTTEDEQEFFDKLSEIGLIYDKVLKQNPGLAVAWNNKGYILLQLDKHSEAIEMFDQALDIDPKLVSAYANKGDALQELNNLELALEFYSKALELEPDSGGVLLSQAMVWASQENYKAALNNVSVLLREDPDNASLFSVQAIWLLYSGEDSLALESLEKVAELDYAEFTNLIEQEKEALEKISQNLIFIKLIESSIGVDYGDLKSYLKKGQWKKADQETARLFNTIISKSSGSDKVSVHAIEKIPVHDLATINRIWQEFSNNKFGFSVQSKIYKKSSSNKIYFGLAVGWCKVEGEKTVWQEPSSAVYNLEKAYEGHLPSLLWAGENGWLENQIDRLYSVFNLIDNNKDFFLISEEE
jgi:tetratricopeptide (TPR) repeat protein